MARRLRHLSNQGTYHVYNRAEGGACIFEKDVVKGLFIRALFEVVGLHQWHLYAYAIMDNHFHLLVSTPQGNLDVGMHALQSDFANKHKAYRGQIGHVFQSRYGAAHFKLLLLAAKAFDYVHLNPVRAGVVTLEELKSYPWTSMGCLERPGRRGCVKLDEGLGHFHGLKDDSAGWEAYLEKLKATLILDDRYMTDEELIGLVRKSRKGSLREAKSKMRSVDRSPEDFRTERMATWGAVLDQALVDEGLVGVDFAAKTKSDDSKVRVAVRVLKHCPATSAWLAGRLSMGTAGNLRRLLAAARKSEA